MSQAPLRTIIIGFGKVAAGYAHDPVMARYYRYATHAQVLAEHPDFSWGGVVDPAPAARAAAQAQWRVSLVSPAVDSATLAYEPEVAVLATPPQERLAVLKQLPSLKGVIVEKPLAGDLEGSQDFLDYCRRRGLFVQVNYWRRADRVLNKLANGWLTELVGPIQAVFVLYGNGLLNNGTHQVDLVRMLFGDVASVQATGLMNLQDDWPIAGDTNVHFQIKMTNGLVIVVQPLNFEHYRENGLDVWGEQGRMAIMQEGLGIFLSRKRPNRAMQGECEVPFDHFEALESSVGDAFYGLYTNLARAIREGEPLCSPGESALQTARVVDAVFTSLRQQGRCVSLAV